MVKSKPEGGRIMAPLQKRALYGLVFGIIWAIALVVVFIWKGGAEAFDENAGFRIIIDVIWIGGLVLYLILFQTLRRPQQLDERDKSILEQSVRTQWLAVILSQVAWIIALAEAYYAKGGVPVIFLYLMFIFTLVVSTVAQTAGILIGYWRMNRHG
jgi:hypothetical protein